MKQKVAIITGGATGIGKSTAFILARQGVKVIICGRREEVGHQPSRKFKRRVGMPLSLWQMSVKKTTFAKWLSSPPIITGALDMAVNNAGISNENKVIAASEPENFQAMLQTNVFGLYLCMKYEIEQMLKKRRRLDCESRIHRRAERNTLCRTLRGDETCGSRRDKIRRFGLFDSKYQSQCSGSGRNQNRPYRRANRNGTIRRN